MSRSKILARGVATSWLSSGVNAVVGILLVPVLLQRFGKEGYGLIVLVGLVTGLRYYLGLGLAGALQRELAAVAALGNKERFESLFNSCFLIYASIGLLSASVCLVAAREIVGWLQVPAGLASTGVFLVRWYAAPAVVLTFVSPLYASVLASNNRFDLINLISVVAALTRGVLLIGFMMWSSAGFGVWAAIMLTTQVLEAALQLGAARRVWPTLRLSLSKCSPQAMASLLALGFQLFLLQTVQTLGVTTDPIVLAAFLGPAAVALYSPPASVANCPQPLIDAMKNQLDPISSASFATGDMEGLQHVLVRGTRFRLLMGILACVVTGCFAWPIVHVWLGRSVPAADVLTMSHLLLCWSVIHLLTYSAGTQWPVLIGMRRIAFLIKLEVPLAVANLVVSIYLVGFTDLGVLGVVIPTLAFALIKRPISAVYCARQLRLPARQYYAAAYRGPLIVLVLLAALGVAVDRLAQPSTLSSLGVAVLLVVLVWCPLAWFVGLEELDRESLWRMARDILRIRRAVA